MRIYVVIPFFNEEKYITKVLHKTLTITKNIICVDDGSRDKSRFIAKKNSRHVLVHEVNLGKGAALKTGCEYAFKKLRANAVVFMDSDGQHDPKYLSLFFKKLRGGAQIVFGIRELEEMPFMRMLGNRFASFLLNLLFQKHVLDIPSGYKALTKSAYNKLKWTSTGYEVETEIAARVAKIGMPYETVEIKATYHDTYKGVSLLEALNVMRFLIQLRLRL